MPARAAFRFVACWALASVACGERAPGLYAEPWPEANPLFTSDATWVGGDGAYSVDFGDGRVLWLFGDSLIAADAARERDEAVFIRNSVALQTGYDPTRAFIRFYYGEREHQPASFVPEDGRFWFWPGHGIRRGERALLFYGRVYQKSEGMWGFASGEATAFLVENPDAEPSDWNLRELELPADVGDVQIGGAVLEYGRWLYVYGNAGSYHDIYLARFDSERALAGDLGTAEWWTGDGWGEASARKPVIPIGAPEFSVHYAEPLGVYVFTQTEGFGPSTLAIRTAKAPEGPWSEPTDVLRPPESFSSYAFVYAGKAHPELTGGDLVVTYVPSRQEGDPPARDELLYFPRFARVSYR